MRFIPEGSGPLLSLAAIVATIAVVAVSCAPAVEEDNSAVVAASGGNPEYRVLFTSPEGCKLYKVRDNTPGGDSYAYMTACPSPAPGASSNVLATY